MIKNLFILLLLLYSLTRAQIKFEYLGVEDGLSQSNGRAIVQDKEGFLWIGTWDGLNRFDGYSFKQFYHNPNNKNSLSASYIVNLSVDNNDRLWIGFTDGRINVFDKKREEFKLLQLNNEALTIPINSFLKLDSHGNYWAIHDTKVIKIETSTLKISGFNSFNKFENHQPFDEEGIILFDKSMLYLVSKNEKIFYLNLSFEISYVYKLSPKEYLLVSNNGEIFSFNLVSKKILLLKDFKNTPNEIVVIYSVMLDRQNTLWVGGSKGLFTYANFSLANRNNSFNKIEYRIEGKQNLGSDVVFNLFEDRSGVIWVGHWTGILKLNPNRKNFRTIPLNNDYSGIFGKSFTIAINSLSDSILLIGTTSGFFVYNKFSNGYEKFTKSNSLLSNDAVYFIHKSKAGEFWLGTKHGLNLFDAKNKNFKPFFFKADIRNSDYLNSIYSITETEKGDLVVGTANGIIFFNPKTYKYSVKTFDSRADIETNNFVLSSLVEKNILWIGTNGEGLLKINLNDFSHKRFLVEEGSRFSLSNNKIMALHRDRLGRLWAATLGGGLSIISADEKTISYLTTEDGLANNSLYGILEDSNGNLWVTSNNGVSKISIDPISIFNYSSSDGVSSIEFNQNSYHKTKKGEMIFGGTSSIVVFHPNEINQNSVTPKIVLSDFKLFNKSLRSKLLKDVIELNYNENFFSFELTALLFEHPEKNQYAYKLEGLNEDWVYINQRRNVDFSGLTHGEYFFKAKAANEDGIWGEEVLLATIIINPPFWKTYWFYFLLLLTIISAIYFSIRYYIRKEYKTKIERLEKEKLILEERTKTRDKIARDLHDDLASTVSSAGLYIQSAKQLIKKDIDTAERYLERSSSILNEAEQSMSDIVWSVSPIYDTLDNLVLRIKILASELCEANEIKLFFENSAELQSQISEDARRNLYLAVKEVLVNSVKHSDAEEIKIKIELSSEKISIEIIDNGKGFSIDSQEAKLGGNGLKNIRKRCDEIGAELQIDSIINHGTNVKIDYCF